MLFGSAKRMEYFVLFYFRLYIAWYDELSLSRNLVSKYFYPNMICILTEANMFTI